MRVLVLVSGGSSAIAAVTVAARTVTLRRCRRHVVRCGRRAAAAGASTTEVDHRHRARGVDARRTAGSVDQRTARTAAGARLAAAAT